MDLTAPHLSRRELMRCAGWAGLGAASALLGGEFAPLAAQSQQTQLPAVTPTGFDPHYPKVPTWNTQLKQLASNVYAYQQQGGPGHINEGISNAGLVIGADHLMAIDSMVAPIQTKAFYKRRATSGKRETVWPPREHTSPRRSHRGQSVSGPVEILATPTAAKKY